MPYCPNCLEEYDDGMTACVMCGSDLIDGTPPGNSDDDLGDMEPVFVGPLAKALPIKSALEDEGFSVFLAGDEEVHVASEAIAGPQTIVKIMVPAESAPSAAKLVDLAAGALDDASGDSVPEEIDPITGALASLVAAPLPLADELPEECVPPAGESADGFEDADESDSATEMPAHEAGQDLESPAAPEPAARPRKSPGRKPVKPRLAAKPKTGAPKPASARTAPKPGKSVQKAAAWTTAKKNPKTAAKTAGKARTPAKAAGNKTQARAGRRTGKPRGK